jgi:hypothetical protein
MKKITVILLVAVSGIFLSGCGYNKMVDMEEQVTAQWSQVDSEFGEYSKRLRRTRAGNIYKCD